MFKKSTLCYYVIPTPNGPHLFTFGVSAAGFITSRAAVRLTARKIQLLYNILSYKSERHGRLSSISKRYSRYNFFCYPSYQSIALNNYYYYRSV